MTYYARKIEKLLSNTSKIALELLRRKLEHQFKRLSFLKSWLICCQDMFITNNIISKKRRKTFQER